MEKSIRLFWHMVSRPDGMPYTLWDASRGTLGPLAPVRTINISSKYIPGNAKEL